VTVNNFDLAIVLFLPERAADVTAAGFISRTARV
jgi:hypothetical protein